MKIVSWNIAGAHPIASLKHLDYLPEDVGYFITEIEKVNPDVVCLQESHTKDDGSKSNAHEIAKALGYEYVFNSPASKSHVEEGFQLSTAILSKEPFRDSKVEFFPNPSEQLYWGDGRPAATHEKNLQVAIFDQFTVANNQMLPLRLFNLSYTEGIGRKLASGVNEVMRNLVDSPVIWCGDFNYDRPLEIYPHMRVLKLVEALPNVSTRPSMDEVKKTPDHIFYSPEFRFDDSDVIQTNSDHFLCVAELERK